MFAAIKALMMGMAGALSFGTSPLYRYPYRQSAEALRGDWLKLGRDIENALERSGE